VPYSGPVVLQVGDQRFDGYIRSTARHEASAEVDAYDRQQGTRRTTRNGGRR
jgi:hypothetical protein